MAGVLDRDYHNLASEEDLNDPESEYYKRASNPNSPYYREDIFGPRPPRRPSMPSPGTPGPEIFARPQPPAEPPPEMLPSPFSPMPRGGGMGPMPGIDPRMMRDPREGMERAESRPRRGPSSVFERPTMRGIKEEIEASRVSKLPSDLGVLDLEALTSPEMSDQDEETMQLRDIQADASGAWDRPGLKKLYLDKMTPRVGPSAPFKSRKSKLFKGI